MYLLYEFIEMQDYHEYDVDSQVESTSIEMELKAAEIQYEEPLPQGDIEAFALTTKPKKFTAKDKENPILENQTINSITETRLESFPDEPLEITEEFNQEDLDAFIEKHVLYGDQYHFWGISEDGLKIIYYQHYNGNKLFANEDGALIFEIKDDEIFRYEQTYLEEIDEFSEPEKVILPIDALGVLLINGKLEQKSEITKVEFGYYTLIPSDRTEVQVLNPVWCFEVDGKQKLFVHAFDGKIVDLINKDQT